MCFFNKIPLRFFFALPFCVHLRSDKENVKIKDIKIFFTHFQLDEFVNKFDVEGPGVEKDMDKGQKLMEIYTVDFEKMESTRVEMGNFLFYFLISISAPCQKVFFFCESNLNELST